MSNLQTYYHFKLDFQKLDQHTTYKIDSCNGFLHNGTKPLPEPVLTYHH